MGSAVGMPWTEPAGIATADPRDTGCSEGPRTGRRGEGPRQGRAEQCRAGQSSAEQETAQQEHSAEHGKRRAVHSKSTAAKHRPQASTGP